MSGCTHAWVDSIWFSCVEKCSRCGQVRSKPVRQFRWWDNTSNVQTFTVKAWTA